MRKSWVMLIVFVLLASVFAGCGASSEGTTGQGSGATQKETGTSEKQNEDSSSGNKSNPSTGSKELTYYTSSDLDEATFNMLYGDAIRKKFPDLNLKLIVKDKGTNIQDLLTAGTNIDLVFEAAGMVQEYVLKYDLQMDMTELIKSHNFDLTRFDPTAVELQQKMANGGIYAFPIWTGTAGLFYNKDIFDKFGVDYPKDGMTWKELYELNKRLTRNEGGVQYLGFVTDADSQAFANQLSLDFVDSKTDRAIFDNEDWKKFMENIVQFYKLPGYEVIKDNDTYWMQREWFEKDRTVAMYANYTGGTPPADMNWDVVSVPTFEEAPGIGMQMFPSLHFVTSISKNKELAFEVLSYLASDEYQTWNTRQGRATALADPGIQKQYGQDVEKFRGKNVAALFPPNRAKPSNLSPYSGIALDEYREAFKAVLIEKKDINSALREAVEATNKKIDEKKAADKDSKK